MTLARNPTAADGHTKGNVTDHHGAFAQQGFVDLGRVLDPAETAQWLDLFDEDRRRYAYFWHPYGHHQQANYDALVTTPDFDGLIRHPKLLPIVESLLGGPACFGEIGLRRMSSYTGQMHQQWHRDRAHWLEHPLRIDYLQLMVYLTDVDEDTHCFSLSPESVDEPILAARDTQLRRGVYDLQGPAGTCALCNAAILHTATTRETEVERKTVQIYYGHRDRPPLANDSAIPATLWRDHPDPETRAFYGVLNERTRRMLSAFPGTKNNA
ncbi:MAG: phytanoyl-CoA dioxygenase family protein [Gammaproteobacteria bacterium]|nr:phytanoyl-CoA dioxygenase family protein [Gammaproteobacteria bacterium]MYF30442.1 phytanoyl-CoA dioxygenase family protein [Gammaproteobacteria bacterium]MYK47524.1 phytanoyl-CoA dioxygenase family protein [Gammaproteobacteria bacterium]